MSADIIPFPKRDPVKSNVLQWFVYFQRLNKLGFHPHPLDEEPKPPEPPRPAA